MDEQLNQQRGDEDYELQELLDSDSSEKAKPIIDPLVAWFKSKMDITDETGSKKGNLQTL